MDTTLTAGEPKWNSSGTLFEGIDRWSERKQSLTYKDVKKRAKTAIKAMLEVKEEATDSYDAIRGRFPFAILSVKEK